VTFYLEKEILALHLPVNFGICPLHSIGIGQIVVCVCVHVHTYLMSVPHAQMLPNSSAI